MNEHHQVPEVDFSWHEVGQRIRDKRIACGLTQAQLGSKCKLTGPGVYFVEAGKINPQLKSLSAIAKALGCSVRELMTGSTARRKEYGSLLEQMETVLAANDPGATLALLNGLQSAQLILLSRQPSRRGLSIQPSEEVLRLVDAAGNITLEQAAHAKHTMGKRSSKPATALRDTAQHTASSRENAAAQNKKENR
ncbi:MAG TPA: helix-turn-helix transcriptional regulator [Candidatus Nanoarchaeia archaeon]|nr:helix-turn-helix transcriptional regulator [Candidatus Nanoarchaeia archaeon]